MPALFLTDYHELRTPPWPKEALPEAVCLASAGDKTKSNPLCQHSVVYTLLNIDNLTKHNTALSEYWVPPFYLHKVVERLDWYLSSSDALIKALRKQNIDLKYGEPHLRELKIALKALRDLSDFARVAGIRLVWRIRTA